MRNCLFLFQYTAVNRGLRERCDNDGHKQSFHSFATLKLNELLTLSILWQALSWFAAVIVYTVADIDIAHAVIV